MPYRWEATDMTVTPSFRIMARQLGYVIGTALVCACGETTLEPVTVTPTQGLQGFAAQLDSIRVELGIPGMAAAIAQNDGIVWARGFGLADVETGRPAADTTSFPVASVTKTIGAIVLMQLVEEGLVDLDDPISDYGVSFDAQGVVTVRHVFNHTSENIAGAVHRYNGSRYVSLGEVMLSASGKTFSQLLTERILTPLSLRHTAPDPNLLADFFVTGLDRQHFLANMAMPYEVVDGQVVQSGFYRHFSPSAGLVASVRDLAMISLALDQDQLLDPTTKEQMLSPSIEIDGPDKTYGLGWYVQWQDGVKLEWHGGEWNAQSALLLRAPEQQLTFVAVANTRRMSGAYQMGIGDVMQSGPGRLFVEAFVLGNEPLP
jgi:CubicO group peptidase (beta-lactamase class C family)